MTPDGMVVRRSQAGPKATADILAAAASERGMTILARIDHAAAAARAGLSLRATEVLIFGDPRAGTPLMQAAQTLGIDLPLKALVWEDREGRTWLGYDKPAWLARRHGAAADVVPILEGMAEALAALAKQSTAGGSAAALGNSEGGPDVKPAQP